MRAERHVALIVRALLYLPTRFNSRDVGSLHLAQSSPTRCTQPEVVAQRPGRGNFVQNATALNVMSFHCTIIAEIVAIIAVIVAGVSPCLQATIPHLRSSGRTAC